MKYDDALEEARRCRRSCALFDFSFVYRVRVSGERVVDRVEAFQPRGVGDMAVGDIRYSIKTDAAGRVRSDLTLWRLDEHCFEIMSGCEADVSELQSLSSESFCVVNLSEETAVLSIQGPETLNRLALLADVSNLRDLAYFQFGRFEMAGIPVLVGRLGYSGEAGFEFVIERGYKDQVWDMLARHFPPAGAIAMDILRIEAGFFLFTNECRVRPTVGELGLSPRLGGGNSGPRRLVAFTATARSDIELLPWQTTRAFEEEVKPGEIHITSACYSPHFESALGLGFVDRDHEFQSPLDNVDEFHRIELRSLPPWDPGKTRPRKAW